MIFLNKFMLFTLISMFTAAAYGAPDSLPVFVSLGRNCETAICLSQLNLRNSAFPFDWMSTPSFDGICRIIESNFIDFLNPTFLKHNGISVLNTLYNVNFRHDFPTNSMAASLNDIADNFVYQGTIVENFLDFLDPVNQKYSRRIDRFLKLLDGPNKIIFLRTWITPAQAEQFILMMKKHYPAANYLLVVIHGDPTLNFNWNIVNVESFYAQEKHPTELNASLGWFHLKEWKKAFGSLGFIPSTKKIVVDKIYDYLP